MPKGIDPAWEQATWNETKLDRAQPGIYSVEGNRLRLCWGELGGERPASLKTKRGDKRTVHLYVRKDSPAPDGRGKKEGEKEPADRKDKEKATDTITRPVVILIDAKTKGIPAGAKIKEIDAPKEAAGKKVLRDVKDGRGQGKAGLDREYVVKSAKITLADDTVVECNVLLSADEPERITIKNIQRAGQVLEATSDGGAGKWTYCLGEYEIAIDPSKDRPAKQRDIKVLQGQWRVVESAIVGPAGAEKNPENQVRKHQVLVSGNKLVYEFHNEQADRHEGTILLDPERNWVDWTQTAGGKRIGTMLGIYEIKGDDVRLFFGVDGIVRPRGFDDVGWLLVLKRDRPETKANRPLPPGSAGKDPTKAEKEALQGAWKLVREEYNGKPQLIVEERHLLAGPLQHPDLPVGEKEIPHGRLLRPLPGLLRQPGRARQGKELDGLILWHSGDELRRPLAPLCVGRSPSGLPRGDAAEYDLASRCVGHDNSP